MTSITIKINGTTHFVEHNSMQWLPPGPASGGPIFVYDRIERPLIFLINSLSDGCKRCIIVCGQYDTAQTTKGVIYLDLKTALRILIVKCMSAKANKILISGIRVFLEELSNIMEILSNNPSGLRLVLLCNKYGFYPSYGEEYTAINVAKNMPLRPTQFPTRELKLLNTIYKSPHNIIRALADGVEYIVTIC